MSDFYPQIEAYLGDELSPEARAEFEARLQTDEALQAEVVSYQEMIDALRADASQKEAVAAFRQMIEPFGEQYFAEEPSAEVKEVAWKPPQYLWMVAAAAVLLLAVFVLLPKNIADPSRSVSEIALAEMPPHDKLEMFMGNGDSTELAAAKLLFNAEKYAEAYAPLNTFLQQNPTNRNIKLAVGICLLETEKFAEALAKFQELETEGHRFFKQKGAWYTAMTLLISGQETEGIQRLEQISDTEGLYQAQAKTLLKLLRK